VRRALEWLLLRTALLALQLAVRLPRPLLAAPLSLLAGLAGRLSPSSQAHAVLADLHAVLRDDASGLQVLRGVLLESRAEQLLATARGALRHHVLPQEGLPRPAPVERPAKAPARVAVLGRTLGADLLRHAIDGSPALRLLTPDAPSQPDPDALPRDLQALEIADPRFASAEFVDTLLQRGVAVSLHQGCLATADMLQALPDPHAAPLRVLCPQLHHPPAVLLQELLRDGALGELASLRLRATVGRGGGRLPPLPPPEREYLAHPAFDQFPLLIWLGGELARLTAYLHPMHPERGGQGLVSLDFAAPGLQGLLELAWTPQTELRSSHRPYGLELEVAGSDGIAWLRRGMAKPSQEAPIRLRVGRQERLVGQGSGLDERWRAAYEAAARDLAQLIRGRGQRPLDPAGCIKALQARQLAERAGGEEEVLVVVG